MSSIEQDKNRRPAELYIYVAGLSQDYHFFKRHFDNLVAECGYRCIRYEKPFDMSNFNVQRNDFFYGSGESRGTNYNFIEDFVSNLKDLVKFLKENRGKVILLGTKLDSYRVSFSSDENENFKFYDSIDNQAKKIIYIINAINNLVPETKITLVGHSQGGLVNLRAAPQVENKIEKIISIATPYSSVFFANVFLGINFVSSIFNFNIGSLINKEKDFECYVQRSKDLTNNGYIESIKRDWYAMKNRPKLFVIVGASGRIRYTTKMKNFNGMLMYGYENQFIKFDGLVTVAEQCAIDNAAFYYLYPKNGDCKFNYKGKTVSCITKDTVNINHTCLSKLPMINELDIFLFSHGTFQKYVYKLPGYDSFTFQKAIDVATKALGKHYEDETNPDEIVEYNAETESLQRIYDIYSSDYSHGRIVNSYKVTKIMLGFIQN